MRLGHLLAAGTVKITLFIGDFCRHMLSYLFLKTVGRRLTLGFFIDAAAPQTRGLLHIS
jgi:hypothetical protein